MKVKHPYGSKERLVEMMNKVSGSALNESEVAAGEKLTVEKKIEIIKEFVKFTAEKLNLGSQIPKILLSNIKDEASQNHSFGGFNPQSKEIRVVIANRNLADVLRTLGHEIVHFWQCLNNKLKANSGETGSSEENEANAMAGVLLREFGKANPVIFE